MKLVLTGATGFVGRQLVPLLHQQGIDTILVGRDQVALRKMFPGGQTAGYDDIAGLTGYDAVLHLATLNTGVGASLGEFEAANVDLTLRALEASRKAGIGLFIFASTFHALSAENVHPYAASKRRAAQLLLASGDGNVTILYLPVLHGRYFAGKLGALNRLPGAMQALLLPLLRVLTPLCSIQHLADQVSLLVYGTGEGEVVIGTEEHVWLNDGLKRTIDIVMAIVLVAAGWWLMLVIALAVRLTSPGPAIFRQDRVGLDGRIFRCYKFRTMHQGTPNVATHEAVAKDVTSIGPWLRRTKLDELPQIVNVLLGQMAFVGPRPCLPRQTELLTARKRRGVLMLRPGITGLAQVQKIDMSEPERLARIDEHYVKMRSLSLDIRLMVATVFGRGGGDRL